MRCALTSVRNRVSLWPAPCWSHDDELWPACGVLLLEMLKLCLACCTTAQVRFRTLVVDYHEARKDQVAKVTYDEAGSEPLITSLAVPRGYCNSLCLVAGFAGPTRPETAYVPPMTVRADMSAQGLGRTEWWS